VVPNLRAGTTYNFKVAAVNAAGRQGALSSVSATTKPPVPPPAPPGAPAGLKATAGQGQVTLSWVAPAGSEVTSYYIYVGGPGFPVGTPAYTGVTGTSYVVPNLRAGTTYNFKVAAVNARGAGPVSPVTSITLPLPPVLRAPGDVEARPGRTRVVVLWTPPTASGGAKVSGYRVYMGTRPGGESRTPVTKALVRYNAVVVKGLDSTTRYYFKVAAVDTTGRLGALSDEVSAVPWPAVAPTPTRSGSAGPGSTGPGSGQGSATGPVEVVPVAGQSSQDLPQDQSSPGTPTWLIILLAGVAGAALAGAVGIAAHLRRLRIRQGMPGAFGPGGPGAPEELDNRPLSGPRYR
jgi:predicted phage tail protein